MKILILKPLIIFAGEVGDPNNESFNRIGFDGGAFKHFLFTNLNTFAKI
jgi:hypothetical protein